MSDIFLEKIASRWLKSLQTPGASQSKAGFGTALETLVLANGTVRPRNQWGLRFSAYS